MRGWMMALVLAAGALGANPVLAQVRTIDPNQAIDSDLATPAQPDRPYSPPPPSREPTSVDRSQPQSYPEPQATSAPNVTGATSLSARNDTYQKDDLLAAGEGAFGKGAAGLGGILENILKDQGEPNAYIVGREGSGAIGIGLRYGSGTLSHKVEGQQPIYWTGPSVGFDLGGDAAKVFTLVYNLYDTEEAFKRFPGGEGRLYFVGGFSATYQRRGNVVLIPIRLGVGWRAGVNVGYTKYTHTSKWMPF